jgi:hypothetical protein
MEYHPGHGWIDELMCYEEDKEEVLKSRNIIKSGGNKKGNNLDDELDDVDEVDELFEEIDYGGVLKDEEVIHHPNNMRNNFNNFDGNFNGDNRDRGNTDGNYDNRDRGNNFNNHSGNYENRGNNNFNNHERNERSHNSSNNYENRNRNQNNFENNENNYEKRNYNQNNGGNNEKTEDTILDTKEFNSKIEISPDLLFNKIPENKKPTNMTSSHSGGNNSNTGGGIEIGKNNENNSTRKEKHVEVDSLFN